jgi:ABC-2 type transport system permease protein
LMAVISKVLAFLKRDYLINTSYRFSFFLKIIAILAYIATFYYIAKIFAKTTTTHLQLYGGEYFPFVLIGIAFSDFLFMGLSAFSHAIRDEQLTGTLGALLISPTRISNILLGSAIWEFTLAAIRVLIYLILGITIFGVRINISGLFIALVVLLLSAVSFSGVGIIAASFIMIFKKGEPISWVFAGGSSLLSGVYYPIGVLPPILQKLSWLLPMTYSLDAIRLALLGKYSLKILLPDILALVIFSLVLLPLSIMLFKYSVKKAKRDGTLLQY